MSNIPVNSLTSKKDRNVFTWQPLGHWKFILIWNVNTKSIFLVECFPHFHFLIKSNYNIKSRVERERHATTCLQFTSCNIIFSMSTVHWDSKNTCIGVKKQILDELYSVPSPYWYSPLGLMHLSMLSPRVGGAGRPRGIWHFNVSQRQIPHPQAPTKCQFPASGVTFSNRVRT